MKTTIADIAQKADVSKMTVSRVLSGKGQVALKTRERILKIIDELGYQPNLIETESRQRSDGPSSLMKDCVESRQDKQGSQQPQKLGLQLETGKNETSS